MQEGVNLIPWHPVLTSSKQSPIGGDRKLTRSVNQSNHVMQICPSNFSPIEGVELCSKNFGQSETCMLIENRRRVSLTQNHCLRPESFRKSHTSMLSKITFSFSPHILKSYHQDMNLLDPNLPADTTQKLTENDLNSTLTHPIDSQTILNSTAEQTDLLTFVENFPLSSLIFRRPKTRPPMRSRQLGRISKMDQIRQHNRNRERAAARTNSRKEQKAGTKSAVGGYETVPFN